MKYNIYGKTDIGQVRDNNEDNIFYGQRDNEAIICVADGMGGHLSGEIASSIAVEMIEDYWDNTKGQFGKKLKATFEDTNEFIFEKSISDNKLLGMGTTLTTIMIVDNEALVAHIGDSRAYLLRDDRMMQLTDDHTLATELKKNDVELSKEAEESKSHILTRTIGTSRTESPEIFTYFLREDDVLLVCSDGLTNMLSNEEIKTILLEDLNEEQKCEKLILEANNKGGRDNISSIVVSIK